MDGAAIVMHLPAHFITSCSRLISAILLAFFLLLCASSATFAQVPTSYPRTNTYTSHSSTNPDVPKNLHTQTQSIFIETISALMCQVGGVDIINPERPCLGIDPVTKKIGYVNTQEQNHGLIGVLSNQIAASYNMPIHFGDYTSYLSNNFGIAKSAYAQTGYASLQPIQMLWLKFRDMTYLGFILAFVVIGFAIMLRVKIDPRTVMSIQNQIPKVVVTLILITFSYAIAGLMIDIMWVGTYAGVNILTEGVDNTCNPDNPPAEPFSKVATENLLQDPVNYAESLFKKTGCFGKWSDISGFSMDVGAGVAVLLRSNLNSLFVDSGEECSLTSLSACPGRAVSAVISAIVHPIAALIVFIAILYALFRLWFTLIKSYALVLMYVIISPLWIFLGVLPTSSQGFSTWFRHLLSRLAVFPAAAFMLILARVFAQLHATNAAAEIDQDIKFIAPLVGNPALDGNAIGWFVALGTLLLAPEALNVIQGAIKAPSSKLGAAAAGTLSSGAGTARSISGAVADPFFGKNKSGQYKPGSYYALRSIGWFRPDSKLGGVRTWMNNRDWKTNSQNQAKYWTDPQGVQHHVTTPPAAGTTGGGTGTPPAGTPPAGTPPTP